MPVLNAEDSRESTDLDFYTWSDDEGPQAPLTTALEAIGVSDARSVVLDETMRADFALLLLGALPGATHEFTERTLGALRMRKDVGETDKLKMNALIADRAMQQAFAAIRPGLTETELARVIKDHFASEGATPSFWIVGSGSNGAFPHHQTGNRQLAEGDAVVIDIGASKAGFPSDITRMAVVGHPPEGYGKIHTIVEQAVQGPCAPPVRACLPAWSMPRRAMSLPRLAMANFLSIAPAMASALTATSPPYITATSETVLEEGMVFSIEPGIYLPGRYGIRLEEIVILRADGPEVLSSLPRELFIART